MMVGEGLAVSGSREASETANPAGSVVLHVMWHDQYGIGATLEELLPGLARAGLDIRLMLLGPRHGSLDRLRRLVDAGIPVQAAPIHRVPRWIRPRFLAHIPTAFRLAERMRRVHPDIVHCHELLGLGAALLLRLRTGCRVAATVHGFAGHYGFYDRAFRFLVSLADCSVTLTEEDHRAFRRSACARRAVLMRNGVDVGRWSRAAARSASLRKELGIPADSFVIGLVGRLVPEKGHVSFLRKTDQYDWMTPTRTDVLVVGEGEQEEKIRAAAKELALEGHVHFLGFRTDMPAVYRTLDVLALPSLRETQPMVVLEAMACGVSVAAVDVGRVGAMLAGGAGIAIPNDRRETFVAALETLRDSAARTRVEQKGHERVRRRFDIPHLSWGYRVLVYGPLLDSAR